ncbi:MAG: hypothetical protein IKT00_05505 [Prevotella sp.]|nr:hypothetical protein [Prevotella sp.]
MIIDENTKRDTVIVDNNDKKDTIIIANDFIVLDKDESIHFNIEKVDYWMRQPRGNRGKQGGDAYNGYLCQFEGGHSLLDIIDIKNKQLITTIQPEYNENYPCNNADFSNTLYDSQDEFPLLYSSQYGKYARCIVVDRIFKQGENYKIETVQRIDLPCEKEKPLQYSPDAILDKKNGFIYVYAGKTSPITDFYIYQFRLPKIEDGKVIKLKENDIVSRWVILNDPAYYKQGGIFINGLLITMEGKSDNKMRIIDLENHRYKLIDLKSDFGAKWEPEDIFEVDGEIFIASGGTGIYKIVFSNE